jgi:betaine-aldehyde dehydrogenase
MTAPLTAGTGTRLQNFVNGGFADAGSGATTKIDDPSTGESYLEAPLSGPEDVDRACRAAAAAFETWRDTTPSDRQRMLLKLADAMETHASPTPSSSGPRSSSQPSAGTRGSRWP